MPGGAPTEGADGVLVVGLPTRELMETLTRLATIGVGGFVVDIGVTALIAARYVGVELEPLRRSHARAQHPGGHCWCCAPGRDAELRSSRPRRAVCRT